jgi:hypothetical protein
LIDRIEQRTLFAIIPTHNENSIANENTPERVNTREHEAIRLNFCPLQFINRETIDLVVILHWTFEASDQVNS